MSNIKFLALRGLSVFAAGSILLLTGCAAPQFDYKAAGDEWIRTHRWSQFETPKGYAFLLTDSKDGTTEITIGSSPPIKVPGHSNLQVETDRTDQGKVMMVDDQTIAVLKGSSPDCPVDYRLAIFSPNGDYAFLRIGDCHSELKFGYATHAQQFFAYQATGKDSLFWVYTKKREFGPIPQSVLFKSPKSRHGTPLPRLEARAPQFRPQEQEGVDGQPRTRHADIEAVDEGAFPDETLEGSGTERVIPTISFDKSR